MLNKIWWQFVFRCLIEWCCSIAQLRASFIVYIFWTILDVFFVMAKVRWGEVSCTASSVQWQCTALIQVPSGGQAGAATTVLRTAAQWYQVVGPSLVWLSWPGDIHLLYLTVSLSHTRLSHSSTAVLSGPSLGFPVFPSLPQTGGDQIETTQQWRAVSTF